jgi:hypothetical protein
MKKLKITLGILFVIQMFAFGSFAKEKSENLAEKKVSTNLSDCCMYWGGTTMAIQVCGAGDQNCEIARFFHGELMKGKIFILSRRRK